MAITGTIPHATQPNADLEAQLALTVPGQYHFAAPNTPPCGSCQFYGPLRGPRPGRRHRCRKAWRTGVKVRLGFYADQTGCRYWTARVIDPHRLDGGVE